MERKAEPILLSVRGFYEEGEAVTHRACKEREELGPICKVLSSLQ